MALKSTTADTLYVIFRIGIGVLFFALGIQKLFGLWGMPGGAASFGSLIWFAGAGEFLIGLALIFGVLVRVASFFGVLEMIIAFLIGHVIPNNWNWNPASNMGMPALVFGLAFIATLAYGAKKASLERKLFRKEYF